MNAEELARLFQQMPVDEQAKFRAAMVAVHERRVDALLAMLRKVLLSRKGRANEGRDAAISTLRTVDRLSWKQLAKRFGEDVDAIRKACGRHEARQAEKLALLVEVFQHIEPDRLTPGLVNYALARTGHIDVSNSSK